MDYVAIAKNLPEELQLPILQIIGAVEENLRAQLAVRREDVDSLRSAILDLTHAQQRTELRLEALVEAQQRTELRLEALAEAQQRTELRLEALAEAQQRTELRLEALAEAQQRTELRLEALIEAQQHIEQRVERLETAITALAEAQQRTELRLEALAEAQQRTELRLEALIEAQQHIEQRVERLETAITALAEAQQRTELRLAALAEAQQRTELRLEALIEAQQHIEQRVERLETAIAALIEAQQRTELRMEALAEAQQHTEVVVAQLAAQQARMQITQDKHTGYFLEGSYRAKPYAYLGRVLRRARTVSYEELEDALERHLTEEEVVELTRVDVIVRGRPRTHPADAEVWLAVEVSATVDRYDVERAQRRAAILRRAGYHAMPVVAGETVTRGGEESARTGNVVLLQNGTIQFWDEALATTFA